MQQVILVLHVLVAICIVALVLVQHGKGADAGAAFGSGASNTMFGSQGSTSFLMKFTCLLAAIFFCTSLGLGYLAAHQARASKKDFLGLPAKTQPVKKVAAQPVTSTQSKQSTSTVVVPNQKEIKN